MNCKVIALFFSGGGERKLNPAKVDGNGSFESREINPNTLTYFMPREQREEKIENRESPPPPFALERTPVTPRWTLRDPAAVMKSRREAPLRGMILPCWTIPCFPGNIYTVKFVTQ